MILILKISFGSAIGCVWPKLYKTGLTCQIFIVGRMKIFEGFGLRRWLLQAFTSGQLEVDKQ